MRLDRNHGGPWLFGRFSMIVGGLEVGDFEMGTSLRDVLFELEEVNRYAGRRSSQSLLGLPAAEAFRLLKDVYGDPDPTLKERANEEEWARHRCIPGVDVLDGWKGFLLDEGDRDRVLISADPYREVTEFVLPRGQVDGVLRRAQVLLEALHERHREEPEPVVESTPAALVSPPPVDPTSYADLIRAFTERMTPIEEFRSRLVAQFRREQARMEPGLFDALNELFLDADCYAPDCGPGDEGPLRVSESTLRLRAGEALGSLQKFRRA